MKSEQEYLEKMSKYRKKRQFHQDAISKINEKMDKLESDRRVAEAHIGEYVMYKHEGGIYRDYLKVDGFETTARGYILRGTGFTYQLDGSSIHKIEVIRAYWSNLSSVVNITEDEYFDALKLALMTMRAKCSPDRINSKTETKKGNESAIDWLIRTLEVMIRRTGYDDDYEYIEQKALESLDILDRLKSETKQV